MLYISVLQSHLYPEGVTNMFKPIFMVHSYNVLGSSNNAFVPMACTKATWGCLAIVGLVWNSLGNKCKDETRSHATLTSLLWLCLELKRTWESFYSTYLAIVYINFCAILECFLLVVYIFSVFLWSCICLNLGLPKTNPASGQSGTWTRGLRIASPAL